MSKCYAVTLNHKTVTEDPCGYDGVILHGGRWYCLRHAESCVKQLEKEIGVLRGKIKQYRLQKGI